MSDINFNNRCSQIDTVVNWVESVECLEWIHSYYGGVNQLEHEVFELLVSLKCQAAVSSQQKTDEQEKLIQIVGELLKDLAA